MDLMGENQSSVRHKLDTAGSSSWNLFRISIETALDPHLLCAKMETEGRLINFSENGRDTHTHTHTHTDVKESTTTAATTAAGFQFR